MALHKQTPQLIYIFVTITKNIRFWQNSASTMHHQVAIQVPNFS